MEPNIARVAMEFLKRVNLAGAEVDAYVAVMNALQAVAGAEEVEVEEPTVN